MVFASILKADESKIAVFSVFDFEQFDRFVAVEDKFNFFIHGERKIPDFCDTVNIFFVF